METKRVAADGPMRRIGLAGVIAGVLVTAAGRTPLPATEPTAPATTPAPEPTAEERVRRLAAIVGTWDTVDTYRPDSPKPIVEHGVRRCGFALRDRYIECITLGTNAAGRQREYRFYLTWDGDRGRYTMLSFWSNTGGMDLNAFTLDETATVWDIRDTAPWVEDGVETRAWSTLRFESPDKILWEGRSNSSNDPPTSWPVSFRETWQRRSASPTP